MAEKTVVRINAEAEKIAKSFMNSRGLDSIGEAVEKLIGTASSRLSALAKYATKQGKIAKPKGAKAEKAAKTKKTKAPKKAGLAAKLSKGPKPEKKSTSKLGGNRKRVKVTTEPVDFRVNTGAPSAENHDRLETHNVDEANKGAELDADLAAGTVD
jgi:hypothetical protein